MNSHFATTPFSLNSAHARDDNFSSLTHRTGKLLIGLMDWVLERLDNNRDRAILAAMDDRELKDIGLTRSDIGQAAADRRPRA